MDAYSFARDLFERVARNVLQVALPIASGVAASGGKGFDFAAASVALVTVAIYTLVKCLTPLKAPADAPLWVQLLDRGGSAAVATFAGFLPLEGLHTWRDWAAVDWSNAGYAAAASAFIALASFYLTPPAFARGNFDLTA